MSSYKELQLLGKMIDSEEKDGSQPPVRVVGFSAPSSSGTSAPTQSISIPTRNSNPNRGSPTAWAVPSPDMTKSASLSGEMKIPGGSFESSSPSRGLTITREPIKRTSSNLSSSLSSSLTLSDLSSSLESSKIHSTMVISAGANANKPSSTNASPVLSSLAAAAMTAKQQSKEASEKKDQQQQPKREERKEQQPKREKQQQQQGGGDKKEQQPKREKQQQDKQQQGEKKEQQPKREKQQQQGQKQQSQQPQQQQQGVQPKQTTPQMQKREAGEGGQAQQQQQGQRKGREQHAPTTFQYDDTKKRAQAEKKKIVQLAPSSHQVPLFSHLPQYEHGSSISTKLGFGASDVHPAILQLGIMYANFKIAGSNARAVAMLTAFKKVIEDFETPPAKSLHRELDIKLKPQIQFLIDCRPMSISMGNAINFLKQQMTQTVNLTEEQAKQFLLESIDSFIQGRIVLADQAIAKLGVSKITHNDVILTFARSHVVELIIKKAFDEGKKFRVVIVDSRPKFEGKALLTSLTNYGVPCTYIMLNGVSYIMKEVSKVFLGAYSMLANGGLVSRAGTAVVASMAHAYHVPVMVCCETYKFTDRVHLDSICFNQLGDPDELPNTADVTSVAPVHQSLTKDKEGGPPTPPPATLLKEWRNRDNLKLLNLLYDLTPIEYILMVITEFGMIPPTSVPVVLREYRKDTFF